MLISKYKLPALLIAASLVLTGCFRSNNIKLEEVAVKKFI